MDIIGYILIVIYLAVTFYLGYYMGGRDVKKKYGIDAHDVIIALSSEEITEQTITDLANDLRIIKENAYERQRKQG